MSPETNVPLSANNDAVIDVVVLFLNLITPAARLGDGGETVIAETAE